MLQMNNRYKELLCKYCKDNELFELLNLVVLDSVREKEKYYLNNNKYPQDRELLSKLRVDLETTKEYLNKR